MTTSCCPAYTACVEKHVPSLKPFVSTTKSPMIYSNAQVKQAALQISTSVQDSTRAQDPTEARNSTLVQNTAWAKDSSTEQSTPRGQNFAQVNCDDNIKPVRQVKTVFIGPCVAKKYEAFKAGGIDFVLNTEELGALLVARGIDVPACAPAVMPNAPSNIVERSTESDSTCKDGSPAHLGQRFPFAFDKKASILQRAPSAEARSFPIAGGVARAVAGKIRELTGKSEVRPQLVDGLDASAVKALKQFASGKVEGNLIEVMACQGGCVAGPVTISKPQVAAKKIEDLVKAQKDSPELVKV